MGLAACDDVSSHFFGNGTATGADTLVTLR